MSIITLLNQIKENEIVLPAIQRDFVWSPNKVLRLLDSIMRGYPIGIVLMWETYSELQYRQFTKEFEEGALHKFKESTGNKSIKLVLDGQQRLQSLYIALYGTYNGRSLYFDVLSGKQQDDLSEDKFVFKFLTNREYKDWEKRIRESSNQKEFFIKVEDLFSYSAEQVKHTSKHIVNALLLDDDLRDLIEININNLTNFLTNKDLLKASIIDQNLPAESQQRKTESDVLEIFVRVNKEGTLLSRSDLIFSMLKLNWKESAEDLPTFIKEINEGNNLNIDDDFIIRCLLAVSDLGTKFDLDLLRKKSNVEKLKQNFVPCCDAIRSTVDFILAHTHCRSDKLLGGLSTLVPFVYYLFHCPKYELPKTETDRFKKALYLFAFSRPFSRYADNRLGKFIRVELRPNLEKKEYSFPLRQVVFWINHWEGINGFNDRLLQSNHSLTLYTLQNMGNVKTKLSRNAGQIDHIFPRSELRKKAEHEEYVNHYGNFWILSKGKNQNKSNKHPAEYFKDVPESELRGALIDREDLDYRQFKKFIKNRGEKIQQELFEKLGFNDNDFN